MINLQTLAPPFSSYQEVLDYHSILKNSSIHWSEFCVLSDKGHHNTVFILLNSDSVVAAFRANVSAIEAWRVSEIFSTQTGSTSLALSKKSIDRAVLSSLASIEEFLRGASKTALLKKTLKAVLSEPKKGVKKGKGRGEDFKVKTARRVFDESSMRCMFEGCAARLDHNELTGDESYFGYLAHIVASSESGPRGEPGLSAKLSDDPANVMLLCDKCHRLIDKVACADYPREKLNAMRRQYVHDKNRLLDLLAFNPVNTYSFCWPVNGQAISPPTAREVSGCLATSKLRPSGPLQSAEDSNSGFKDFKDEEFWCAAPAMLRQAHARMEQTAQQSGQSYGVFAMGPMPLLVGLGALIGNKSNAIPALRFRDSEQWVWPLEKACGSPVFILEPSEIPEGLESVIVRLELTASPESFETKAQEIRRNESSVDIILAPTVKSNGCIGHPDDGLEFQKQVNGLLHRIATDYQVTKVHLLPCASNAACIYFGRAIEQYHSDVVVYDFVSKDSIAPRMLISPTVSGPSLSYPKI